MYLSRNRATVRRLIIGFGLACALLGVHGAHAWNQVKTKTADAPVSWESSCFQYSIQEDGCPDIDFADLEEVVRASFDEWEAPACSFFYFEETATAQTREVIFNTDKANVNLLVWLTDPAEWTHGPDAVALTHVSANPQTGLIYDADLEFNAGNFSFGTLDEYDAATELIDLQSTITHEIGHMIGLDHTPDFEATMYDKDEPGSLIKRSLAPDDIAGLCTIYPSDEDPEICEAPICGLGLSDTDVECYGNEFDPPTQSDDCARSAPGAMVRSTGLVHLIQFGLTLLR